MQSVGAYLYIHGKGGSAAEARHYAQLCPVPVIGVDYDDFTPWGTENIIQSAYERLHGQYGSVSVIANSIGAYFTMLALGGYDVKRAFFISPVLDMERLIGDMMAGAGVSESELKDKREIKTDYGETLSWRYLEYAKEHRLNWSVPTEILYAENDNLTSRYTVDSFVCNNNASLTVMNGGEHWFHTDEQLAFLDDWFRRTMA